MQWAWWPAAESRAWDWRPEVHPGVWLFLLALVLAYVAITRRARRRPTSSPPAERGRPLLFALGTAVLWLALDWPLGSLAGYLLTAHVVQYLLTSLAAAPLLLLALPRSTLPRSSGYTRPRRPSARRVLAQLVTYPLCSGAVFALVLLATYLPVVVDTLRPHPLGSFAIATAWLAASLLFWWPVVGPVHARAPLPYTRATVYLFLAFVLPKLPALVFIFSERTTYRVYEDAARATSLSPHADELLAGLIVWLVGSLLVLAALAVLIFRWYGEDRRMSRPGTLALPADPRAVEVLFQVPGGWTALERLIAIVEQALASPQPGSELSFRVDEGPHRAPGQQPSVLLELHLGRQADEDRLPAQIHEQFDAYLRSLGPERHEQIAARLSFRVVAYGSRVS